MASKRKTEEELKKILEDYTQFMNAHVQKFNLLKFGLDPEDIMQEVRIRIWKLVRSEKIIINQASYLKKIVHSAVIDQIRKFRREENLYKHEKQKRISELELAYRREVIRKRMLEEAVGKAVERLIDSRRQVVKLYLLNLSIQEISCYLNWSQDKTRNLLYRGLADLRESLKQLEDKNENKL
jgi:RNA polymerase sigma factor (sigma-70 family)